MIIFKHLRSTGEWVVMDRPGDVENSVVENRRDDGGLGADHDAQPRGSAFSVINTHEEQVP